MKNKYPIPLLAQNEPGDPVNQQFQLLFTVTGAVVQCPGFTVPPGCTVTLEPVSGTALNVGACFIAAYPEALRTSAGRVIAPGTGDVVVPWPVTNLSQIFAMGVPGDGVLIKVQGGGIQ